MKLIGQLLINFYAMKTVILFTCLILTSAYKDEEWLEIKSIIDTNYELTDFLFKIKMDTNGTKHTFPVFDTIEEYIKGEPNGTHFFPDFDLIEFLFESKILELLPNSDPDFDLNEVLPKFKDDNEISEKDLIETVIETVIRTTVKEERRKKGGYNAFQSEEVDGDEEERVESLRKFYLESLSSSTILRSEEAVPHSFPYQVAILVRVYNDNVGLDKNYYGDDDDDDDGDDDYDYGDDDDYDYDDDDDDDDDYDDADDADDNDDDINIANGDDNNYSFCGGSLISKKYVLTAAHCVDKGTQASIFLGAHDIEANEPSRKHYTSSNIIIHEDWSPKSVTNDIALVELSEEVQLNEHILTVSLPDSSDLHELFIGEVATVSGWGKKLDSSLFTGVLLYTESTIITNEVCGAFYSSGIQSSNICTAGFGGNSVCKGDSGSPLVIGNKQVGIVSFGTLIGCHFGWPTGFTRVTSYMDWIVKNSDVSIT